MFSLSNQIKAPDDEEQEEEDQPQDCDNSLPKQTHLFTPNSWIPHNQKSPVSDLNKRKYADFESGGGRKDRHSKVRTARGPRDRRVRLSPRTAIQFYDVQDRLGYDRPSKAIDWLIQEAKAAIDALHNHSNVENHNGFFIEPNPETGTVSGPVPGFGFCIDGAPQSAPPFDTSADLVLHQNYQQGLCSAFSETNWEFARLQKMLEISSNPPPAFYSPAPPVSQREPLQSSFINYSPISNGDFPAFNFCNELLNVTASAMKQDEREKKLLQQYED